ncbi:unnamed protein product [Litomosoides sigmodontis]|uniref:Uncharacterized protein n=1 Tax=Litomosoides sigmodontis TaxID=42156 RepID=A0A3P6V8T6_LITSI|nr:unnamed protein product [Litomosoides sigmodontis]
MSGGEVPAVTEAAMNEPEMVPGSNEDSKAASQTGQDNEAMAEMTGADSVPATDTDSVPATDTDSVPAADMSDMEMIAGVAAQTITKCEVNRMWNTDQLIAMMETEECMFASERIN